MSLNTIIALNNLAVQNASKKPYKFIKKSRDSYQLLDELRRFRHFKRYYYDFDYDWNRLDYLRLVYEKLRPIIKDELENYTIFLTECANPEGTSGRTHLKSTSKRNPVIGERVRENKLKSTEDKSDETPTQI